MKPISLCACIATLLAPLAAQSQYLPGQRPPSVTRPGPAERDCKKLDYPLSARRDNKQGVVTLRYVIDKDGTVLDGKIIHSSGYFELDNAALAGLAKCGFKVPEATKEPVSVDIQYEWKLD